MNDHYQRAVRRYERPYGANNDNTVGIFSQKWLSSIDQLCNLHKIIDSGVLTLTGKLACPEFEANDLIYYPELALYLRQHADYLSFSRQYSLEEVCGSGRDFLASFSEIYMTAVDAYNQEGQDLTNETNRAIERLIKRREPVVVQGLDYNAINITGLEYKMCTGKYNSVDNKLSCLHMHRLVGLGKGSNEPEHVTINNFKQDTPYVDIRIRPTYDHAGKINWVDLDTMAKVNAAEMKRYRKTAA